MKVAIDVSAIPAQPAGAGIYVLRVVEALAANGAVDLELVARADDGERWKVLAPDAEVRAVAPRSRPLRLLWEQVAGPALARNADVWHGPHYTMPMLAWTPRVVTVHDLTFFDHPEWHESNKVQFFRRMIRWSTRHADVIVCVSERTAGRLRELLTPEAPVIVASHGVDHDRFVPAGDDAVLEPLGLDGPFVAFVGTIEPRKNVPALVEAVARLDPSVRLVLAGQDGWGVREVDAAIAEHGMGDRVVRLGYVDDAVIPALFRRAAAVAYPAFEEGFGLPALEALACGAALVTTSGSPMEDVVEDAAVVVPPGDNHALTEALRTLLAGGPDVERLRTRGPEVAAAHTWARSAERHLEAYRLASAS
ncbi:MAG: glycosyltransferase [Acidimicrobiales bacterium]|nr:glycosyltransferase [Acidimicrobiales bacterium]